MSIVMTILLPPFPCASPLEKGSADFWGGLGLWALQVQAWTAELQLYAFGFGFALAPGCDPRGAYCRLCERDMAAHAENELILV